MAPLHGGGTWGARHDRLQAALAKLDETEMNTKTLFAALIAMPMLLGATAETFAWSKSFKGTRDQVRVACKAIGGDLRERAGSTSCGNPSNGNHVTCTHNGQCEGGGAGPMPRVRTGMIDLGILLSAQAQAYQVPESLTSGSSSGSPAGGDAGGAYGNIGQWHAQQDGGPIFYAN